MAIDVSTLAETVTDLEVKLAYQERTVATLDQLVRTLYTRVELMERELRTLRDASTLAVGPGSEPPPHY